MSKDSIDSDTINEQVSDIIKNCSVLPDPNGVREITNKEYWELCRKSDWLSYLEAAGVANWEGYDIAYDIAKGDNPEFERP